MRDLLFRTGRALRRRGLSAPLLLAFVALVVAVLFASPAVAGCHGAFGVVAQAPVYAPSFAFAAPVQFAAPAYTVVQAQPLFVPQYQAQVFAQEQPVYYQQPPLVQRQIVRQRGVVVQAPAAAVVVKEGRGLFGRRSTSVNVQRSRTIVR